MKDFAAIDFETANFEKTSVCAVGIAARCGFDLKNHHHALADAEACAAIALKIL